MNAESVELPAHMAATLRGARVSGGGRALPELWRALHGNTALIVRFSQSGTRRGDGSTLRMIADAEVGFTQDLMTVPADDWAALCAAAGWTETGAAALSWCKGAVPQVVWQAFRATGQMPAADAAFLRAARLMRPDHLPKGLTLSTLFAAAGQDIHAVCLALAARPGLTRLDYSPAELATAPQGLRDFLAAPAIGLLPPAEVA
jgi:hypothetical protein